MVQINNQKILRMREAMGVSQKSFAERIGLSPQGLNNIERGLKNPASTTLYLIAKELGCSVDELYIDKDKPA